MWVLEEKLWNVNSNKVPVKGPFYGFMSTYTYYTHDWLLTEIALTEKYTTTCAEAAQLETPREITACPWERK